MTPLPDDLLRQLADDAFTVLNAVRRLGAKREQQLDEVVKAFKKRLAEAETA